MSDADGPATRCPVCLSRVGLDRDDLWVWEDGEYRELWMPEDAPPDLRARWLRGAHVRCPNHGSRLPVHYLPHRYVDSDPVVVAIIGAPRSGKTHLLASVIGAVQAQGLDGFGLLATALDTGRYERFLNTRVRPLFDRGQILDRTAENIWEFEVGLLVTDQDAPDGQPRAVAFFDVAGDELSVLSQAENKVFLDAADAFVFVVDAEQLARGVPDAAFSAILNLVPNSRDKAAVLVLSKADRFRFEPPVDRWLRAGPPDADPARIEAETRDLYAFVTRFDEADGWLRPWAEFGRSAIHAVSATGGPDAPGQKLFARPVRPQRVLSPFVTLMAMTGVIGSDEARRVGL
ncbi:hypothetical protein ACIBFB_19325 [Nocardiopsis sp. NPDC050513]|uniref:TRAFAC clade GTPase domain-containing protein n=1 Tax=Nocardiopsis sp. NPDC050513 TaxID=3364338 RepID=UPI0037915BCD